MFERFTFHKLWFFNSLLPLINKNAGLLLLPRYRFLAENASLLSFPPTETSPLNFEELAKSILLRRYETDYYDVVTSYMDESFDMRHDGIFAVGGLISRGVSVFELERKWEDLCKRPEIDIAYFKASHCERGTGEFKKFAANPAKPTAREKQILDSISEEFIRLIPDENHIIVHGIGVIQKDFYEVIESDSKAKTILGDSPYFLGYHLAMIQCAWAMKQLELEQQAKLPLWQKVNRDYIAFFCDESEKYSPLSHSAYAQLKKNNPNAADFMGSYSEGNEKRYPILQAADAAIFEVRRALNLELGQWNGYLRKQFNTLVDAGKIFLIQLVKKPNLINIVATHKPGEPFKFDEIMEDIFTENIKFSVAQRQA
jgi:hypothetical protein